MCGWFADEHAGADHTNRTLCPCCSARKSHHWVLAVSHCTCHLLRRPRSIGNPHAPDGQMSVATQISLGTFPFAPHPCVRTSARAQAAVHSCSLVLKILHTFLLN